jgi:hypothetical protein
MQHIFDTPAIITLIYGSQFPLWDFFECNTASIDSKEAGRLHSALNSLCGISLNATNILLNSRMALAVPKSLNSLCGISLNATEADTPTEIQKGNTDSQFPLWDFFECNIPLYSAPFLTNASSSQFPLWDFFECNTSQLI